MIILSFNSGPGWEPIAEMASLAAELFDAEHVILDSRKPSTLAQLELILLKRQKTSKPEACLLIAPIPTVLLNLIHMPGWRKRFSYIAAWVIDSYWINLIPKSIKLSHHFDHVFITTEEDIPEWIRAMKTPTSCLAWGSDVLRLGGTGQARTWDLTRIGRQPLEWDDDAKTAQLCLQQNIRFHGRVKGTDPTVKNQVLLTQHYQQTKFLLAFSNVAHRSTHTHSVRQYITARWTDALACGAIVAGIPPKEPGIDRLLWEGATLDLKTTQIEDGLQVISEAVRAWKPEQAAKNYQLSLERLDWRWRFAEIALVLNESPIRLADDIKLLKQRIADTKGKPANFLN